MKDENQEAQTDSTGIPPKRKRGRPRKSHVLYTGEKAHAPQRLDGKKKPRRKKIDSSMPSFPDNTLVGQSVHGVLDGSFDAGYLLMVRVGDTDTVLRGVVFDPGLSVPISKANDIAPNVNLTRRDENILLPPELPPSIHNTVAMPSTPVPLLPAMVPVVNSQGTTSVPIPDQTTRPVQVGSNQSRVALGQPNGSLPKSVHDHSSQINKEAAPKPGESFSYLQQPNPIPTGPVSRLQQPMPPTGPVSRQQQPIPSSGPVSRTPIPTPAEPVFHAQQSIPTLSEPISRPQQSSRPLTERVSHPQQPIPLSGYLVKSQMSITDNVEEA